MSGRSIISLRALGTSAVLVSADPAALPQARRVLVGQLRAFDLACSRFRDDSELSALNRAAGHVVAVGDLLWDALAEALRAAEETGGIVDPTVGRTLRLSGYDRTFTRVRVRDGRLVEAVNEPAGRFRELELDADRRTVRLPRDVELDLGATAKALAADRIAVTAAEATRCGVLVSLGGDVAVAGEPPLGGWPIRIADDHRKPLEDPGPTIAIGSGGVATSTTTVRRWQTAAGERHHIVDPRTGQTPAEVWRTVSVVAGTCIDANVASTAAIVLGEPAPGWLEVRNLPARLVRVNGAAVHTREWPLELAGAV